MAARSPRMVSCQNRLKLVRRDLAQPTGSGNCEADEYGSHLQATWGGVFLWSSVWSSTNRWSQ